MVLNRLTFCAVLLLLISPFIQAKTVRISQIDSSHLLLNQEIRLYLSIVDENGNAVENLRREHFSILESDNGQEFTSSGNIKGFQVGSNYETGVNFLLLVDDSESMYWTLEGEKTNNHSLSRMTYAIKAIQAFLKSITNPNDKVGLAVYNSYYTLLAKPETGTIRVESILKDIQRPSGDAIYSEIYGSLALAVDEFQQLKGRKAIIILSDGINNPAFHHTRKINPQFGQKNVSYSKPLHELQVEGISLYVVNFGPQSEKKDRNLVKIAGLSGGSTFNAHNPVELQQIYLKIMDQILKEYVISYQAPMSSSEKKYVRVNLKDEDKIRSASRVYFTGSLFGPPPPQVNFPILLASILGGVLLWIVSRLRFERQHAKPTIEVIQPGAGSPSTQILTLEGEQTIIGSGPKSDMTIAGVPEIENHHATIIYDSDQNQYKLVAETRILVNNQIVKTKILESGDLINLNGVTIVFDEGTDKENK